MPQDENVIFDELCDEFETELRLAPTSLPDLEAYLGRIGKASQARLLDELLALEQELLSQDLRQQRQMGLDQLAQQWPQCQAIIDRFRITEAEGSKRGGQTRVPSADRIGPYRLLGTIGEGGMGSVYLAEQSEPVKRRVALKVIKSGLDSQQVIARFEAERQALAMMDHPTIARILDAGTTDRGQPFFAMEYVEGVPLNDYCDQKQLTVEERLEIFCQICEGVQHAHQKGIIHRDLKPANILVTEYNGKPLPKIIDFGLAKALNVTEKLTDRTMFTEFGQVLGTLKYISPEQAGLQSLDIDTRSDIFTLGIILYELLTGTTPFDQADFGNQAILQILAWVREQETPRPSDGLSSEQIELSSVTSSRKVQFRRLSQILAGI